MILAFVEEEEYLIFLVFRVIRAQKVLMGIELVKSYLSLPACKVIKPVNISLPFNLKLRWS